MRRLRRAAWWIVVGFALAIAPTLVAALMYCARHPQLIRYSGHQLHALVGWPRIQYWNGKSYAIEFPTSLEQPYYREVTPDWDEQYAPSRPANRMYGGGFDQFDQMTRWGFAEDPWWPPIGPTLTFQSVRSIPFPGARGQQMPMRAGVELHVHTVLSWFVLLVAAIPWLLALTVGFVRARQRRRRRRAGPLPAVWLRSAGIAGAVSRMRHDDRAGRRRGASGPAARATMTDQPHDEPPPRRGVDPDDIRRALEEQLKKRPPRPPVNEMRPPIPPAPKIFKPRRNRRKP